MKIHSFSGRYPGRTKLAPGNMHGTVHETEHGLNIRLGDRQNLDFWIEFTIDTRTAVHDTLASDAVPQDL